jgi:uncharacterized membrane protein YeaQ/YmgE (transglycosylase-associated protein family)
MGLLAWIVMGLLAGIVAKVIMPGPDGGGIVMTILLGVVGAIVGGFVGQLLGLGTFSGFDLRSFGLAVLGSLLLLVAFRLFTGRRPV